MSGNWTIIAMKTDISVSQMPDQITAETQRRQGSRRDATVFVLLLLVGLSVFVAMPKLSTHAGVFVVTVGALGLISLVAVVILRPVIGLYVLAVAVALVESDPVPYSIGTDRLYVYFWPSSVAGLPDRPIGLFLLLVLLVLVTARLMIRKPALRVGPLSVPLLLMLACVVLAAINGMSTGGDPKTIYLELRPWEYLVLGYLLAYNLITDIRQVRTLLWIIILGTGIKGLQGVYIVVVLLHGQRNGINEIMEHEQSYFFATVILLILLFIIHGKGKDKRQLFAALSLIPFIVQAMIANNRRAEYAALIVGLAVGWVLIATVRPEARGKHVVAMALALVLGGAYVLAFSHVAGTLGTPARSIISVVQPSATDLRDLASNLYRDNENFDLLYTFEKSPVIGYGFGKPFLEPKPLVDISAMDPVYLYVPHNNVYWVLMRMGMIGYLAFWYLMGATMIRGIVITKHLRNPYVQVVAIFCVACLFMQILVAWADYQLYFYRTILFTGLLMGMLMRLPAIDADATNARKEIAGRTAER